MIPPPGDETGIYVPPPATKRGRWTFFFHFEDHLGAPAAAANNGTWCVNDTRCFRSLLAGARRIVHASRKKQLVRQREIQRNGTTTGAVRRVFVRAQRKKIPPHAGLN